MKDCSGQEIVPVAKRLVVCTNRHSACDGTAWGWIEGCSKNICWADNKPFNYAAACRFVKEYNESQKAVSAAEGK